MPTLILKITPDRDLYMLWSTVVDGQVGIGDRAACEACLRQIGQDAQAERFARADRMGSSAFDGDYGWLSSGVVVYDGGQHAGGWLPRSAFPAYAQHLLDGDHGAAVSLLEPFEDEAVES